MFEESIKEGKARPDFSGTDAHQVSVTLSGEVQNPAFLRFLERVGKERLASFITQDLLILDSVQREIPLGAELQSRVPHLLEQGVIERIGHGRGVRLILSRKFHSFLGQSGAYTRRKGLDRETNKALLLRHIQNSSRTGTAFRELEQVLPELTGHQVQKLLQELKTESRIRLTGARRAGKWFPGDNGIAPQ